MRSLTEARGLLLNSEEEGDIFGRDCDFILALEELPDAELLLQKVKPQHPVLFIPCSFYC